MPLVACRNINVIFSTRAGGGPPPHGRVVGPQDVIVVSAVYATVPQIICFAERDRAGCGSVGIV